MSKIFRCLDCGKDFRFMYNEIKVDFENVDVEEYQKMIDEYTLGLNFPSEINICYECLQNINTNKNKSTQINSIDTVPIEYIHEFNERYSENENELKNMTEEEEKKKINELNQLKEIVGKNESEVNLLLKELENIEETETKFCNDFRDLESKLYFIEKELSKTNNLKLDYENKIKNFASNNIFTELFQISVNDKYASINECKFCDPYTSNNYDGINAGWGYIILLTKLLAIRYMFKSKKYDLIPEGNFSKIINITSKYEYELGISDISRTKDKFNTAMYSYLDYLDEFLKFLTEKKIIKDVKEDAYPKIKGNTINNKSIQIESKDNLENWYQCMKYLLTILKFLICQVLNDENEAYKKVINNTEVTNNKNSNQQ